MIHPLIFLQDHCNNVTAHAISFAITDRQPKLQESNSWILFKENYVNSAEKLIMSIVLTGY